MPHANLEVSYNNARKNPFKYIQYAKKTKSVAENA